MQLILYSKPGCHLCEGLQEKLEQVNIPQLEIEVRDITTRDDWFQRYQYEIPVLYLVKPRFETAPSDEPSLIQLPRLSPRASAQKLEQLLQQFAD